jgi:hypothetical protein
VLLRLLTISSPKLSPVFGPSLLLATHALPTSAVPHELCQLYAKVSGGPVLGTPGSQNRATHKNRSPHGALNPHAWCIWSWMLHLPCNMATSSAVDVRAALSSLFRGSGRPTWPRPWHGLAFGQYRGKRSPKVSCRLCNGSGTCCQLTLLACEPQSRRARLLFYWDSISYTTTV